MDIEDLISKVQLNAPIWDKRIKDHSNRNIIDACWRNISLEMNFDGALLRKKWKYLRDQFTVEYSKAKSPRSGDAAEMATEPKWPYFKQMLFLKDVVTPRASSSNLKQKAPTVAEDREVKGEDDESQFAEEQDTDGIDLNETTSETQNQLEFDQPARPTASQHRKRRRVMATNAYNEKFLQLEQKKINTIQSAFQREPENDDLMFFKSLLPFVSKIPAEKKLRFRSRIQQVVDDFAFPKSPSQQPNSTRQSASDSLSSPTESTTSHDSGLSTVDHYIN